MIIKATSQLKHCLSGFHDITCWNANNDRLLVLGVDIINIPPSHHIDYPIYYIANDGKVVNFGSTKIFNYPQGARQQWIGSTNQVIVNDLQDDKIISKIYNTDSLKLVESMPFSTHIVADNGDAFGLDYARLFRLGAYGYSGAKDLTEGDDAPESSGIIWHNIFTKKSAVILSVKDIAGFNLDSKKGHSHYITHLVLSPNQKRIAFLHRYKLNDGGETTRLCTIGTDGSGLRCLASGFLSHFDWKDNSHVMIWGRIGSCIEKFRDSRIYQLIPPSILPSIKNAVKKIIGQQKHVKTANRPFAWLVVNDDVDNAVTRIAENTITEDGHPMFCPTNRDWMICDTYPDEDGVRRLFLYQHSTDKRIELGGFRRLFDAVDIVKSKEILSNIDNRVIKAFGWDQLAFTRSGLHCDLHPRWSRDGRKVAFDSIHEGTRQVYVINVGDSIK